MRGIKRAVINRHLDGDLVKFYGVAGTNFFFWFYPMEKKHSKFGDENINGMPAHFGFDPEKMKRMSNRIADILGVKIYGGDCIIAPDGSFKFIDFNDWPSFAPCRREAAPQIARAVLSAVKEAKKL